MPSATQRVNKATTVNETFVREELAKESGQKHEAVHQCLEVRMYGAMTGHVVKPVSFSSGTHFISDRSEIQCENEIIDF